MKENRDKIHLERIIESIEKIDKHIAGYSLESFLKDEKTRDSVLMQFVTIGESVNNLSDDFREKHQKLPWHKPVGLRNEIAHGYFNIKPKVIWQTIKDDLPTLKKQISTILKK